MSEINSYRIVVYGSSEEKPNLKAKIELYAEKAEDQQPSIGKIRFYVAGAHLPADVNKKGSIIMNLPVGQLELVIELLRNQRPVYFAFHEGRAVLGSGVEQVGGPASKT